MRETLALAVLFLAAFAATGCDSKEASPSAQPAAGSGGAATKELTLDLGNKLTLKLAYIPAGKFMMGSPSTERRRWSNETQRKVTISRPLYMGVHEVTVDQYAQFMAATSRKHYNPGFKQAGDHPVVNVSWDDAQAFCQWLSTKSGKNVHLPTEAQWEYACRAGSKTAFCYGGNDADLIDYAWFVENSLNSDAGMDMTHPVGQKKPNAWGLYDMHGNVWEWCEDAMADYASGDQTDPVGPRTGRDRVARGGSFGHGSDACRSAFRLRLGANIALPHYGFRIAATANGAE